AVRVAAACWWFFFSSRRRHTRCLSDWSSDVCSSDLLLKGAADSRGPGRRQSRERAEPSRSGPKLCTNCQTTNPAQRCRPRHGLQIGRATCRERVESTVVEADVEKKRTENYGYGDKTE